MKTVIQKFGLLTLILTFQLSAIAQTIQISAAAGPYNQVIANGTTFDATLNGMIDNFEQYLPVVISIKNTGAANLVLTKTANKYITAGGTGATDFTIDESNLTGTIAPGATQTFSISLSSSATTGTKTVSMLIKSNDAANASYTGSIKYTLSSIPTSITKASEIGLYLYPNPSDDGNFYIKAENVTVNRIVVSNVNGVTEEYSSTEFRTTLKGLLLIQLYTSRGLVSEKILVQ